MSVDWLKLYYKLCRCSLADGIWNVWQSAMQNKNYWVMWGCSCTLLGSWTVVHFLSTSLCLNLIYCGVMLKALFAWKIITLAHEPSGILTQRFRKCHYQNFCCCCCHFVNLCVKLQEVTKTKQNSHKIHFYNLKLAAGKYCITIALIDVSLVFDRA